MKHIVIFGIKEAARLACGYLRHDTDLVPVAYTVTQAFMPQELELDGLPIVPFESIVDRFPPDRHAFIAPMSYRSHNRHRARTFTDIRSLGYRTISYVSPRATLCPGVAIGTNTMVLEGTVISPRCVIGDNVMIQAGCVIAHDVRIGDHAFLAPGAVLAGSVDVGSYAFIGAGGVIRDRVRLGEGSFLAMGSVVRNDTEAWTHHDGNPARPYIPAATGGTTETR